MKELKNKIDFVLFVDVKDGNPNGDPDAGNMPRVDAETGEGLITDVCLKRKVRNYIQVAKAGAEGYDIFIKENAVLNTLIDASYENISVKDNNKNKRKKEDKVDKINAARKFMCAKYYDVRTFGAVMTTGKNAGQVRGPIQLTFARSVDPIVSMDHSITRICITKEENTEEQKGVNHTMITKEENIEEQNGVNHTMGRKSTVPYGLYMCHGFVSANLAKQTGFSEEDLELFWTALKNMFDCDRSASRGLMSSQKLIVFRHDSELGNVPANKLFDLVKVEKKTNEPARSFDDYQITVDTSKLPVISTIKVDWPEARSSEAPILVNTLSTMPTVALLAGTKEPIWAISTIRAV